jgi:hypothetical protein
LNKAHECVDALQSLVRGVDAACIEAELKPDVSGGTTIRRRREEICEEALHKLASFRPFEIAENALSEKIGALEPLAERSPDQVKLHQQLTKALQELREGVEATKRMVLDRCRMRQSVPV